MFVCAEYEGGGGGDQLEKSQNIINIKTERNNGQG